MVNSIGPVHDLLESASGAIANSKIVYTHMAFIIHFFSVFIFSGSLEPSSSKIAWARRLKRCCTWHYCSWTNSVKLSLLFSFTVKFRYYDHPKLRQIRYVLRAGICEALIIYSFLFYTWWLSKHETIYGTVQKWSLRPLLDSPKGGLNSGILLYLMCIFLPKASSF